MKHNVTTRLTALMAAAAIAAIAACSDSNDSLPTIPNPGSVSTTSAGAAGTDTSKHNGGGNTGGNTGGSGDTVISHQPGPQVVAKYTLNVHVGSPRVGSADTLANDPIVGAVVSVVHRTYVRNGGTGSDSLTVVDDVVATAVTQSGGNASFPGLKGADAYVIKVDGPDGAGYKSTSVSISQATSENVTVSILLRKQ